MTKTLKNRFKYLLPVSFKKILKYLLYSAQDFIEFLRGKSDNGYPPKRLNFVGSGEFKKVGDEFVGHFIKLGGLKPTDTVLDIGSGIGRMAIPLSKYLDKRGELCGFDIDKRGIKWCRTNLAKKFPNFHFEYVDIFNKFYNKKGKIRAEQFVFPYDSAKFDFIFATSVFTHMLPDEVKQYLSQIGRVVKPGGKCFLTFFSIDGEAERNISTGTSHCNFKYSHGHGDYCFYSHKNVPEAEIGYKENWIIDELKKVHCAENLKIFHGSWANRTDALSYQDIFLSEKEC